MTVFGRVLALSTLFLGSMLLVTPILSAEDRKPPTLKELTQSPERNPVEKTVDDLRNLSREREQQAERESMRDTSHDRRLKVAPNTSLNVEQKEGAPMI